MADPLTIMGAISGASQLAGQFVSCTIKLHQLLSRVRGAPKYLEDLHCQSQRMAGTLQEIPDEWTQKFGESLRIVTSVLLELETMVDDLREGMKGTGNQAAIYWSRLIFVLREERLKALVTKLVESRSQLQFDMTIHIAIMQETIRQDIVRWTKAISTRLQSGEGDIGTSDEIIDAKAIILVQDDERICLGNDPDDKDDEETSGTRENDSRVINYDCGGQSIAVAEGRHESFAKRGPFKTKSYWLGVGRYQKIWTQYQPSSGRGSWTPSGRCERSFVPFRVFAPLRIQGFSKIRTLIGGYWKTSIMPIVVVPDTAPMFEACRVGDTQQITRLLESRQVSIYDTTEIGLTPLHVAEAHQRPKACNLLLSYGVKGDAREVTAGRTTLHVAARASGAKSGNFECGYEMKPYSFTIIDNSNRLDDILDCQNPGRKSQV